MVVVYFLRVDRLCSMLQMDLQLPELTQWKTFEELGSILNWFRQQSRNGIMQSVTILLTLLWGKLIDFYTEFDEDTKSDLDSLKKVLLEKAGLQEDLLIASKTFNQHDQLQHKKVDKVRASWNTCLGKRIRENKKLPWLYFCKDSSWCYDPLSHTRCCYGRNLPILLKRSQM